MGNVSYERYVVAGAPRKLENSGVITLSNVLSFEEQQRCESEEARRQVAKGKAEMLQMLFKGLGKSPSFRMHPTNLSIEIKCPQVVDMPRDIQNYDAMRCVLTELGYIYTGSMGNEDIYARDPLYDISETRFERVFASLDNIL